MTTLEAFRRHVAQTSASPLALEIAYAEGSTVIDVASRSTSDKIASRSSSLCNGSWWKSSSSSTAVRWANASVSDKGEWPQPMWLGYSSSVY